MVLDLSAGKGGVVRIKTGDVNVGVFGRNGRGLGAEEGQEGQEGHSRFGGSFGPLETLLEP